MRKAQILRQAARALADKRLPTLNQFLIIGGTHYWKFELPPIKNAELAQWETLWQTTSMKQVKSLNRGFDNFMYNIKTRHDAFYLDTDSGFSFTNVQKHLEWAKECLRNPMREQGVAWCLRTVAELINGVDTYKLESSGLPMKTNSFFNPMENLMTFSLCYRAYGEDFNKAWFLADIDKAEKFESFQNSISFPPEERKNIFTYFKQLKKMKQSLNGEAYEHASP